MFEIATFHIAPGHWAGHMRIYHRECLTLVSSGYDVALIAHGLRGERLNGGVVFHDLGPYGEHSTNLRPMARMIRCWRSFTLARAAEPDLFHIHSPEFIPFGLLLKKLKPKIPIVFDCMEDFEGYALQRRGLLAPTRAVLFHLTRLQLRAAARRSDAFIFSDEGTAKQLAPYTKRAEVVYNFPPLHLFPDHSDDSEKTFDITYHGSMPRYNLEVILEVDRILGKRGLDPKWLLIGRMSERRWFLTELERRRSISRFTLKPLLPHNEIAAHIRRAKVGIIPLPDLPKFRNNIPQKLFEFMALRMPVVLSNLPPSHSFVGDQSCAFLVPPDDYDSYADSLALLLKDDERRRKMGEEGRKRVEAQYNWELESKKLTGLYEELLKQ